MLKYLKYNHYAIHACAIAAVAGLLSHALNQRNGLLVGVNCFTLLAVSFSWYNIARAYKNIERILDEEVSRS